jgi:osmoprotectant transport system ATP-binding protein
VRDVLEREGTDWLVVVDDRRLLGWVAASDLCRDGSAEAISADAIRPFAIALRRDASLREALDTLVSSPNRVAVVVDDDDRYLGLVDVSRIGDEIEMIDP